MTKKPTPLTMTAAEILAEAKRMAEESYLKNKPKRRWRDPCPLCGKVRTREGYDACLGELPGVANACCGARDTCLITTASILIRHPVRRLERAKSEAK